MAGPAVPGASEVMLGIVCGMADEARALGSLARHPGVRLRVSGADPDRAARQAEALIAEGCGRLLSWGIAGGLVPDAGPGTLWTAREVLDDAGTRLPLVPLADAGEALLLGLDAPLLSAGNKREAHARTAATLVDMETHRLAAAGRAGGVPVHAVRAVADPLDRSLPEVVTRAIDDAGRPRIAPVLADLARRPALLPVLIRLAGDRAAALRALRRFAREGGLETLLG